MPILSRLPRTRRGRLSAGAVALAALGGGAFLAAGTADERGPAPASAKVFRAADGDYALKLPAGWTAAPAKGAEDVATIVTRPDRKGMLIVRERPRVRGSLGSLPKKLGPELGERMDDAEPVSARIVRLGEREALTYTFIRSKTGMVQSITVVPAGSRTFTLEGVVPGDSPEVARQIGAIVGSFES